MNHQFVLNPVTYKPARLNFSPKINPVFKAVEASCYAVESSCSVYELVNGFRTDISVPYKKLEFHFINLVFRHCVLYLLVPTLDLSD